MVRCDVADFPLALTLNATLGNDAWTGAIDTLAGSFDLETVRSVYYRRPTSFNFPEHLTGDARVFAELEARAGLFGILASLRCRWINSPTSEIAAAYKPIQLARAASVGLRPPASIITSDPNRAKAFISLLDGPALYKGLGRALAPDPATVPSAATRIVEEDEIDESIGMTAHLFQEFLDKSYEVRVTVVGRRMFAVEIHAWSDAARLDWRTDYAALTYSPTSVSQRLQSRISALMHGFGLVFGALDFVVTQDGDWRFLELNPNGQWLWLAAETGLPIAEAIGNELSFS